MGTSYGYYDPDGHDDWFDPSYKYNPLDSMPIATDPNENPRPEEEIADNITMHEKMYRLATKNGTTITMGGSENVQKN